MSVGFLSCTTSSCLPVSSFFVPPFGSSVSATILMSLFFYITLFLYMPAVLRNGLQRKSLLVFVVGNFFVMPIFTGWENFVRRAVPSVCLRPVARSFVLGNYAVVFLFALTTVTVPYGVLSQSNKKIDGWMIGSFFTE